MKTRVKGLFFKQTISLAKAAEIATAVGEKGVKMDLYGGGNEVFVPAYLWHQDKRVVSPGETEGKGEGEGEGEGEEEKEKE